ncbi:efflux RND transporter periplasmic adaptor subunit [Brevundimonas subvibrioides]|uniref:efflux RND transporter periplasmic adaptor subunit n=1 Tax=Brevundimonas subvibrioides TaxID=74313 RepID=UPI0022B551D6|nr:efflux RND transporter periplasmic adaptor subunit [Brevundimonas subvibrioides]
MAAGEGQALVVGTVRSLGAHEVAVETGGRIVRLYADVGDRVHAGQVLAELDAEPMRLQVAQVQAELRAAQTALEGARREAGRLEGLVAAGAASRQDLDSARTTAQQAESRVDAISAQSAEATRILGKTAVRAPADGVITARQGELSSVLTAGAALFSLDAGGAREIVASVPGTLVDQMTPGQSVSFRFGGAEGVARLVGVSSRAAGVDARSSRFLIVSGAAPQGAAVELRLAGRDAQAGDVTVPLSALLADRAGGRRVLLLDNQGRASATPVALIDVSSRGARVRGRIVAGQSVVAAGGELVKPGQKLRPLPYTS